MIVLGIDPGIAIVGYAIVREKNSKFQVLEYGCITTSSKSSLPDRISYIYDELSAIINEFEPDDFVIEELFFNKNIKTAITVAQARGSQILAAQHHNLPIYEYTPLQIKQAVTGYGRADKIQVQETIKNILSLSEIPKPDDAADALAICICHLFTNRFKELYRIK
ncbi:MAG: crossover junction endodeoxyribonuclease RuvC [Tissierellia bacterium]|nr:crossover junction endodeoxyribonuclease RuvC [Tissierellia bacterium]